MLVTVLLNYLVFLLINCTVWPDSQWSQVRLEPDVFKATDSTEPLHCSSDCLSLPPAVIGQVVTPTRVGQSYTYSPGQHNQQDLYDVPPSRSQGVGVSCSHSMYSTLVLFSLYITCHIHCDLIGRFPKLLILFLVLLHVWAHLLKISHTTFLSMQVSINIHILVHELYNRSHSTLISLHYFLVKVAYIDNKLKVQFGGLNNSNMFHKLKK